MSTSKPAFPNYTQLPQRVPQPFWYAARILSVGVGVGIILTLFIRPDVGLFVFWRLVVPFLPILFFVAPGLWRNICPMAALNQTPRLFKFTRALTLPPRLKEYAYVIGIVMFFVIVPTRKALFNADGPALGVLLAVVFTTAFLGGYFFKGKSGWCSSFCPLLPVQRLYGQTPFVSVPNNHCKPCVGCAKNCYDFNPAVANMADQYDSDRHYSGYRKFFAGAFPGLILAFYTIPDPPKIDVLTMYGQIAVYILISVGLFLILDTFIKASSVKITTLFGAMALNFYYLFNIPTFADTLHRLFNLTVPLPILWAGHALVFLLTAVWIFRTYEKEPVFVAQSLSLPTQIRSSAVLHGSIVARQSRIMTNLELTFEPDGKHVLVTPGRTILEVAEGNNLTIEAGCRMGVCGADPVAIRKGMGNLSPVSSDEKTTLERLGFAENTRMACCARIQGPVAVALKPDKPQAARSSMIAGFKYNPAVKRVVIIGNGIAGVTAADHVRRRHPTCEIYVVAREKHPLYNRMGLSRLVYGRSAMQGLYLMPEAWYEEHQVNAWLNTHASKIDREKHTVETADGASLPYDRLILAMGSAAATPPIEGFGKPGTFVLREADDAMGLRAYVQQHHCHVAVVAGGGLLGLEAAYALHKLGLEVTVLERSKGLMRRQLDERGGYFLTQYLAGLGITILTEAEMASIEGERRTKAVTLKDGRQLPNDLFLVCAGIKPNIDMAQEAGLQVKQGVIVDDHMRTSAPDIYAAGDVAEYQGQVPGLWPIAVEQAEVAAVNAIGGDKAYAGIVPTTMLKVAGVDLTSIGQFEVQAPDETAIVFEDVEEHRYRKLVISHGKIVGGILLGYSLIAPAVTAAIKQQVDVTPLLGSLRAGNWDVLNKVAAS